MINARLNGKINVVNSVKKLIYKKKENFIKVEA